MIFLKLRTLLAGLSKMNNALPIKLLVRNGENDDSIREVSTSILVNPGTVVDDVIDDIKSQAAQALISGNFNNMTSQ